jgi:hypothetical protein
LAYQLPALAALGFLSAAPLFAASSDAPALIEQVPNPNDYSLFANSGWDGALYACLSRRKAGADENAAACRTAARI